MVVIPHLEGLCGSHLWNPGQYFLYFVVSVVRVGMVNWCGMFPICIGNLDAGSLLSSSVSHFSLR